MKSIIFLAILSIAGVIGSHFADKALLYYLNDTPILNHVRPALNEYNFRSEVTGILITIGVGAGMLLITKLFRLFRNHKRSKAPFSYSEYLAKVQCETIRKQDRSSEMNIVPQVKKGKQ